MRRICDLVESGQTFGDAARTLKREATTGRRGKPWVARTVRTIVHNATYRGEKGYPALIEPGLWDASTTARDALTRQLCSAAREAVHQRTTPICSEAWPSPRIAEGRSTRVGTADRMYVCANRRQSTGLCDAAPIPAVA